VPSYEDKPKKEKKPSSYIFKELQKAYVKPSKGWRGQQPTFPEIGLPVQGLPLMEYEQRLKSFNFAMKRVDCYHLLYNFFYGAWIQTAFDRFQVEKKSNFLNGATNFDDWVDVKCGVNRTKARQLRKFFRSFKPYQKALHAKLPFDWFIKNGSALVEYFEANPSIAEPWTHYLFCECDNCVE